MDKPTQAATLREVLRRLDGHSFHNTAHDIVRRYLREVEGVCETCKGSGDAWSGPGKPMTDCSDCGGTGRVRNGGVTA